MPVELVAVGNRMLVRPGERLPLNGVIAGGRPSIDEAALTGESVPVDKQPGDKVFAAAIPLAAVGTLAGGDALRSSGSTPRGEAGGGAVVVYPRVATAARPRRGSRLRP